MSLEQGADELPSSPSKEKDPKDTIKEAHIYWPKYAALFCVVVHQTAAVFTMRYSQASRKAAGRPAYLSTVAVFATEVAKFMGSFVAVAIEERGLVAGFRTLRDSFQVDPWEMLRLTVPALLYAVQNNLLFLALAHLTAAVYTVSYQLKTLTTALFSVIVLRRELSRTQWVALAALSTGVALLQLPSDSFDRISTASPTSGATPAPKAAVSLVGMACVGGAAVTSGFCGVYMEKLLKQSKASLFLRNAQLALAGAPISLACALISDFSRIQDGGLLQGFDGLVWGIICINALGGLAIAAVLRYADNIVKCFATAGAVLVSCILSNLMGELELTGVFMAGTGLVAVASVMYGLGASLRPQEMVAALCPASSRGKLRTVVVLLGIGGLFVTMSMLVATRLDVELPMAR